MKHLKRLAVGLVVAPLIGGLLFATGDLMACGFSQQMPHPITLGYGALLIIGLIYKFGEMVVG